MARKPSLGALVSATLTGAAGGLVGYFVATGLVGIPGIDDWFRRTLGSLNAWDLLAIPLLALLVIAIHEIGHLLGGLSQGMRFLLLIFGPFQWYATAAGIRFRWVTNLGQMGGMAATVPVRMEHVGRQMLPMAAGGPVASLLLTGAAVLLSSAATGRPAGYAAIVALLSLMIFLVTAIPFRAGGFMSDGMQVIELARGGGAVMERTHLMQVLASSLAGVRPRDWDPALVARIESMESSEPLRQLACWMLLLQRAMDGGEPSRARQLAAQLAARSEQYPDGFRQSLHIELVLEAALRQDLASAEQHLALTRGGVTERSRLELARALVCMLRGETEAAATHVETGRKALGRAMDPGTAQHTAEQLTVVAQHLSRSDAQPSPR